MSGFMASVLAKVAFMLLEALVMRLLHALFAAVLRRPA
ncbi:MAG: hypothetical protein K0R62_954 [Nonomuraea muscovyensis]|nr:hypothetical protein [Nonomuraea muscovyensis]